MMRTRLHLHGFADKRVRVQIFARGPNLGDILRRPALPACVAPWSMTAMHKMLIFGLSPLSFGHAKCSRDPSGRDQL